MLSSGISFKYSNQNIIELWQNDFESDNSSDSQVYPLSNETDIKVKTKNRNFSTPKKTRKQNYTYICDIEERDDENVSHDELLHDSDEEENSVLAVYDYNSVTSLWLKYQK